MALRNTGRNCTICSASFLFFVEVSKNVPLDAEQFVGDFFEVSGSFGSSTDKIVSTIAGFVPSAPGIRPILRSVTSRRTDFFELN